MPNARDVPMRLVPSRTREDETNHFSPARNLRTKPHRRPVGEDSRPLPYRTKYSLREECRLFLVPLSYRARLVDFAVHLSPQRKESPPLVQPLRSLLLPLCITRQIQILLIDTDIGKEIDRFRRESTPLQNRQLSQEKQKNEREHQQSNHMPVFVFRGIIPLLFILHFGYSNETTKIEKGEWRKKNSPYFSTKLPSISAFHTKIGKDLYLRTIPSKFHSSHSHFLQFSPSS